jgi:hypothetical protein
MLALVVAASAAWPLRQVLRNMGRCVASYGKELGRDVAAGNTA